MEVILYNFQKKDNSTARPTAGSGTSYTGALTDPSGVYQPSVRFDLGTSSAPGYNYAYIAEFGRYYWITEWTWSRGFWTATMTSDALASARTQIGSSTEYVLRSSAARNGSIVDNMYPTTSQLSWDRRDGQVVTGAGFASSVSNGCFVIGMIGAQSSIAGSVTYFALDQGEFNAFNSLLMSSMDWTNIDFSQISGITEQFTKTLFNPYQYIASCIWLPIRVSDISGTNVESFKYGWWDITGSAKQITFPSSHQAYSFNLGTHPQIGRGSYLQTAGFTDLFFYYRPCGGIQLNANDFQYNRTLVWDTLIDVTTGKASSHWIARSEENENVIVADLDWQCAVNVPVTQMGLDIFGGSVNAVNGFSAAAGAGVGGNVVGLISGLINTGISAFETFTIPTVHSVGGLGGFGAYYGGGPVTVQKYCIVANDDNTHLGRPLCEDRVLNTIPGYIQVAGSSIVTGLTQEEDVKIREYMEGGFYYE